MKTLVSICLMIIVGCFLFFGCSSSLSTKVSSNNSYYNNPKSIIEKVSTSGARKVVDELYNHPDAWDYVLKNIAEGSNDWLQVAVKLHTGSDAGSSEMLSLAVGEALENNPENVFEIALGVFKLESVCAGPDIDNIRYNTYENAIKAIERRQERISLITDPKYMETRDKCIILLEKSKGSIADYYEINDFQRN